jgi:hypothetical protein
MNRGFIRQDCADTGFKMRCLKSLITQIKKDYAELNQLWQKVDSDKIDEIQTDELIKKISWIKQGLKMYREYRNNGVEGIVWVDIEQIVNDLQIKENQIIGSVSKKKEKKKKKEI